MTTNSFVPKFYYLTMISNGQLAVVTTEEDHDYVIGQIVSFRVTAPYGMTQINNKQARILDIPSSNTFTIELDTTFYNPFIYPVSGRNTPPVVVPAASGISPTIYPKTIILDDAFDNVRVT